MIHNSIALVVLALLGASSAAPAASPNPINLPTSSDTQNKINQLRNQITTLTNAISQNKSINAKDGFTKVDAQFQAIASCVKTPSSYKCPPSTKGPVQSIDNAIVSLRSAESDLDTLALHLQNAGSENDLINTDFCYAYADFQAIGAYVSGGGAGSTSTSIALSSSISTAMSTSASQQSTAPAPSASPVTSPASQGPVNRTPTMSTTSASSNATSTNPTATPTGDIAKTQLDSTYHHLLEDINSLNTSIANNRNNPQNDASKLAISDLRSSYFAFNVAALGKNSGNSKYGCVVPGSGDDAPMVLTTPPNADVALSYVQNILENANRGYQAVSSGQTDGVSGYFCVIGAEWPALAQFVGNGDLYNE